MAADASTGQQTLVRGIGLGTATALNMIDMIGVGPFITIPLIVTAMGGPQAMLGWIAGACLVLCDGLVWAELGAAMPGSGGSYRYLKEIYNPERSGKFIAFLFIWQLSFSAPLSIASGCVGLAQYVTYLSPSLVRPLLSIKSGTTSSSAGLLPIEIGISYATLIAMAACVLAGILLYRRIGVIGKLTRFLWVGVLLTIGWVIFAGITHFDVHRAFSFPENGFALSTGFFQGLGAGMLVAVYDYWGYYNICFIGDEVKDPARTIPRAILLSILLVAIMYLTMNLSILGVIPWQEMSGATSVEAHRYLISLFMERLYGSAAGIVATILIIWTAFASVFSLLLGYSRVPYAAAVNGEYFHAFSKLHPRYRIPHVSLLSLCVVAILCCTLKLADIIAALVVIRIIIQFIVQTIGLLIFRTHHPDRSRPFRMWLYPAPAIISLMGFVYILFMRKNFFGEIRYALIIIAIGTIIYMARAFRLSQWPFQQRRPVSL